MNWNGVMARAGWPIAGALVIAAASMAAAHSLTQVSHLGVPFAKIFLTAAGAALLFATVYLAYVSYRIFSWQRGGSVDCRHCGGPLGFEREGKRYRGKTLSNYRKCYACGRATPAL